MAQARELGLSALVETQDVQKVERALAAGASIIGVNNRDLRTFQVDVNNSVRLRTMVSPEIVFAPGKRQVTPIQAAALAQNLSPAICPVGVFLDAPEEMICGRIM